MSRDAAPTQFSAERAVDMLRRILGDQVPHPTGSLANRAVRDRLRAELSKMGYAPVVRSRVSCAATGTCATVDNVFTELAGKGQEPGVLLVSHYDSVAAGPGASDDGSGVATLLEVARALKADAQLARDVWFLFTDGEEMGLLGAEAFIQEPEFKEIGIAINFEARGTTGRSRLIETSDGNRGLIAQLSAATRNPAADSLTSEIYKTVPYADTDLTVFVRTGVPSLGFAYAEGAARYHTLRDDIEHLDRGSLQDHGNNALPLAREFATHGVRHSDENVVFFNLFGLFVSWPQSWNFPFLVIGLVGWVALVVRLRRRARLRLGRFFLAIAACTGIAIASLLLGIGLRFALVAAGALPSAWTAQGAYLIAAFALLPIALLPSLARRSVHRLGAHALAAASFTPFACIATAAVVGMPGGSFVGLLPLLVGVVVANLWPERVVIWAGALAAAATPMFSNVAALYSGLGEATLPGASMGLAIGFLPLLAVLAAFERPGRMIGVPALAGSLAAVALAVATPAFTRDTPARTGLMFFSRAEGAQLYASSGANELSPAVAAAGEFENTPTAMLPSFPFPFFGGKKGPTLPAPRIELLEDASTPKGRELQLHLRSSRDASCGALLIPSSAGLIGASIQGVNVPAAVGAEKLGRLAAAQPWRSLVLCPLGAEGARFSIELSERDALKIQFFDISPGLPPELHAIAAAREAHVVAPHSGDVTVSWSELDVSAWQPVPTAD